MDDEIPPVFQLGQPGDAIFNVIVVIEQILQLLGSVEQVGCGLFKPVIKLCFSWQELKPHHGLLPRKDVALLITNSGMLANGGCGFNRKDEVFDQ
jgi:hypothetical protein